MRVKTSGFDDFIASQLEIFVNVIMGSKFCIFCINLYFDFLKKSLFYDLSYIQGVEEVPLKKVDTQKCALNAHFSSFQQI